MSFALNGKKALSIVLSVLLTTLFVAFVAQGTTYVDTDSVGVATATPGGALGVKGEAYIEGFLVVNQLFATSTSVAHGFGTSSPGADFSVGMNALFNGLVVMGNIEATSTDSNIFEGDLDVRENATSTFVGGMNFGTSSLIVDNNSGRVAIGTTSVTDSDVVATTMSVDPALTISGTGAANNATGTMYIAGEGAAGGQLLLKVPGTGRCVSITATNAALDVGDSGAEVETVLSAKVVSCPR